MSSTPAQAQGWRYRADEQELEELRLVLHEQRTQLGKLQAARAPQQAQEAVQHMIVLYERALREAEELAAFHKRTGR